MVLSDSKSILRRAKAKTVSNKVIDILKSKLTHNLSQHFFD